MPALAGIFFAFMFVYYGKILILQLKYWLIALFGHESDDEMYKR